MNRPSNDELVGIVNDTRGACARLFIPSSFWDRLTEGQIERFEETCFESTRGEVRLYPGETGDVVCFWDPVDAGKAQMMCPAALPIHLE